MQSPGAAFSVRSLPRALLFIVLLSAIVVEFAYDAQVDASLATNFGRDFEAYIAAKSAVHDGMAVLQENVITFLEGTAQGGSPLQRPREGRARQVSSEPE